MCYSQKKEIWGNDFVLVGEGDIETQIFSKTLRNGWTNEGQTESKKDRLCTKETRLDNIKAFRHVWQSSSRKGIV